MKGSLESQHKKYRIISLVAILLSICIIGLYFCPIFLMKSVYHGDRYYNAFEGFTPETQWCLMVSLLLLFSVIGISIYNLFSKKHPKLSLILTISIYALAILFSIMTFIFAVNSTNYPK